MPRTFSEATRVQIPAILHLSRLGYTFRVKVGLVWDRDTNILTDVFFDSLKRINKNAKESELRSLLEEIKVVLKNDDLGEAFFKMLQRRSGIRLVDFFNIDNNDFSCTYEMPFVKDSNDFRPDITVYINGIPLAFIEVKVPNNRDGIEAERRRMNDRLSNRAFKHFFNELQLLIFSNNMEYELEPDALVPISGAFYSTIQRENFRFSPFREENSKLIDEKANLFYDLDTEERLLDEANAQSIRWTREYKTNCDGHRPTNRILTSLLSKERFLFLLNYGFCYVREKNEETGLFEVNKHVMRYPQLLGSLSLLQKLKAGVKKGIFWHTQGSGKTELSFYLVKILTDYFAANGLNSRYLFIPDRMDLFSQACGAFSNRGLKVSTVNSKSEFAQAISSSSVSQNNEGRLEMLVVNTQKLSEEASVTNSTHYSTNNQTVLIVDECHRSYDNQGTFLANLINIDRNAVIIGLTGTPLILGKDTEKSKALFGNYIHTYYYNQSIADGCTLKLMREEILKTFYDELQNVKNQLIQQGVVGLEDIYSHPKYVAAAVKYIKEDFYGFQSIHDAFTPNKKTGAMVVCYCHAQAVAIAEALGDRAALITYKLDKTTKDKLIEKYQKTNDLDFLVVEDMLLTGFDCARLKKMYLLKKMHAHTLLQALTRVNRPFKKYKYGYIVDFEGIMGEFQKTNDAYMRELNQIYGDDVISQINIFVDAIEIERRSKAIDDYLFSFNTDDIEVFTNQINEITDYEELRRLKKTLDEAKDLYNASRISDNVRFYKLDISRIQKMSREVDRRYEIMRLQASLRNSNPESAGLLFQALESIDFNFIKVREHELVLADRWRDSVQRLGREFSRNVDNDDPQFVTLYEELRRIMSAHDIEEVNEEVLDELEALTAQIMNLNASDMRIALRYNNDYKFVRIHKRFKTLFGSLSESEIHSILTAIKRYLDGVVSKNGSLLNNEPYFERIIQREVNSEFRARKVLLNREQMREVNVMIFNEYFNEYRGARA
ncbi:MAG: DEAD/DEAH box helicase family protein [Bacilli bacterium]|nr:DEAD/DEAH box helicase family protein [Bacilli bacterium]